MDAAAFVVPNRAVADERTGILDIDATARCLFNDDVCQLAVVSGIDDVNADPARCGMPASKEDRLALGTHCH